MGNFHLLWQSVGQVGSDQESLTSDLQFLYNSLKYIISNPVGAKRILDN